MARLFFGVKPAFGIGTLLVRRLSSASVPGSTLDPFPRNLNQGLGEIAVEVVLLLAALLDGAGAESGESARW